MLVHGGMAQNVGPILEMVTEKYLLRSEAEWKARQEALGILDEILGACAAATSRASARSPRATFSGPIQTIIPWASNLLHRDADRSRCGRSSARTFWGFWMLGGMSGGGMGFIFAPGAEGRGAGAAAGDHAARPSASCEHALPFAMEPVVYDFAINERGTCADLLAGERALMPPATTR